MAKGKKKDKSKGKPKKAKSAKRSKKAKKAEAVDHPKGSSKKAGKAKKRAKRAKAPVAPHEAEPTEHGEQRPGDETADRPPPQRTAPAARATAPEAAPPDVVDRYLAALFAAVRRNDRSEAEVALEYALDAAALAAQDAAEGATIDVDTLVAAYVRSTRFEAGWTQDRLAGAMRRCGIGWQRSTVADIERGSRRTSLAELLALCALFGLPVVHWLEPRPGEALWLGGGQASGGLDASGAIELVVGSGGSAGGGGASWQAAAGALGVAGGDDWRPAADLWERRAPG